MVGKLNMAQESLQHHVSVTTRVLVNMFNDYNLLDEKAMGSISLY
jgi:hypothetical protein